MLKSKFPVLLLFALAAVQARAQSSDSDPWHDCGDSHVPVRVQGCTAIIASTNVSNEDRAVAYFSRGLAYYLDGATDKAIADFTAALGLHPADSETTAGLLLGRGTAYITNGQADPARSDFTALTRLKPTEEQAWSGIGQADVLTGHYADAISFFDKSLSLKPDIRTRSDRAYALLKLKRYREALADYDLALKDNNAPAAQSLYGRGLAEQALGESARAASDMAAAEKLTPDIAKAFEHPMGE